jgi:hypothetical protein
MMKRRLAAVFAALAMLLGCTAAALPAQAATGGTPVPVYRVYNNHSGLHHYTTNLGEKNTLVQLGWRYEGVSFNAAKQGSVSGLKPVYREYNPHNGNHNWTLNQNEHNKLVSLGWRSEGVAWYANPAGSVTVYRLYNPYSGEHVYTTSVAEYVAVGKAGWHQEGVAWKGIGAAVQQQGVNIAQIANGNWSSMMGTWRRANGDTVVFTNSAVTFNLYGRATGPFQLSAAHTRNYNGILSFSFSDHGNVVGDAAWPSNIVPRGKNMTGLMSDAVDGTNSAKDRIMANCSLQQCTHQFTAGDAFYKVS